MAALMLYAEVHLGFLRTVVLIYKGFLKLQAINWNSIVEQKNFKSSSFYLMNPKTEWSGIDKKKVVITTYL